MSDIDLPISGKDTQIRINVAGAPVKVIDAVTNFRAERVVAEIEHKPMGTNEVFHDDQPEGWRGSLEIAAKTKALDEAVDVIDQAQRARVPLVISIVETTYYRNGTSKTYTYPDCKINLERSGQRGEHQKITLPWKTGKARIAT